METLYIGHSPDADDAFMFYALAEEHVKIGDYKIDHVMEDIESLNRRARTGELPVTAISACPTGSSRLSCPPFFSGRGRGNRYVYVTTVAAGSPQAACSLFTARSMCAKLQISVVFSSKRPCRIGRDSRRDDS